MKKFRWDKKYLYWGMTAFCVIVAAILFYMLLNYLPALGAALKKLGKILSPFIWGLVIAYLLHPLERIYFRRMFLPLANAVFRKGETREKKAERSARLHSVFLAEFSLLVIVAGIVWMVAPQIYTSVVSIVENSSDYIATADQWINKLFEDYPQVETAVSQAFGNVSGGIFEWVKSAVLPRMTVLLSSLTSGVYSVLKGLYNAIIGLIVSVYVLCNREIFGAHLKKIIYCIFSLEAAKKILGAAKTTNEVFLGFISGKILDSVIIGLICYIGTALLGMPYPVLISAIVGVTNVIPFFGPFIGAIPSGLIILMVDPLKCLIFVIFIIILQQFDGNILGPKILGSSVGINGFWIMFSIILGAGLFGFGGMLLGVPVFVLIYTFFRHLVNRKLQRSGLSRDSDDYRNLAYIDPRDGNFVHKDGTRRRNRQPKKGEKGEKKKQGESGKDSGKEKTGAKEKDDPFKKDDTAKKEETGDAVSSNDGSGQQPDAGGTV